MAKHKSEDYKTLAVQYYLTKNIYILNIIMVQNIFIPINK